MMYQPDKWIILKLKTDKGYLFKVLAGWSGSYLEGQSWKINSGIKKISEEEDFYLFEGYSGSLYKCHKKAYGCNMMTASILNQIIEQYKDQTEVLEDQDFSKLLDNM